jgi:hypothetical protein
MDFIFHNCSVCGKFLRGYIYEGLTCEMCKKNDAKRIYVK